MFVRVCSRAQSCTYLYVKVRVCVCVCFLGEHVDNTYIMHLVLCRPVLLVIVISMISKRRCRKAAGTETKLLTVGCCTCRLPCYYKAFCLGKAVREAETLLFTQLAERQHCGVTYLWLTFSILTPSLWKGQRVCGAVCFVF